MAKGERPEYEVVLLERGLRVTQAERTMTIRCCVNDFDEEDDDTDVIVYLDDITGWDPPHDHDTFEIEDLQKLLQAIESACARHGLGVTFD
jgi:hypothetical protein